MTLQAPPPGAPRAYGGCTCSCHRGSNILHAFPCCHPSDEHQTRVVRGPQDASGAPGIAGVDQPLNRLAQEIREINRANGWRLTEPSDWSNTEHLLACLQLIVTEVAEATRDVQNDNKPGFDEELADVLIRTLGLAKGLGIDIDAVVRAKMEKNRTRGYRHGGKRI